MRAYALITTCALLLGACGSNDKGPEQAGAEESINVARAQGNDITAIDAATGADANMAADVEFISNDLNAAGNEADDNGSANEG